MENNIRTDQLFYIVQEDLALDHGHHLCRVALHIVRVNHLGLRLLYIFCELTAPSGVNVLAAFLQLRNDPIKLGRKCMKGLWSEYAILNTETFFFEIGDHVKN